jgi:hypothetical protein
MDDVVARHRHVILSAAGAVAAVETAAPWTGLVLQFISIAVLLLGALRRPRPAAFAVRPDLGAFTTVPQADPVYRSVFVLLFFGYRAGETLRGDELWRWQLAACVLAAVVLVVLLPKAWRGYELSLRPATLRTEYVDEVFLASAIGVYAAYAQERAGIGTEEGYRRLRLALGR